MNTYMVRRVVAACTVAGSMLMVPTESHAIFHWGGCSSCGGGATTAYRPYVAGYTPYYAAYAPAPACNTCNTCSPCGQVCNYMPQTCYRTVYQQVPVTAYQPVSSCDACGNQVTAMRPVVTYQMQARMVPYTTYRPVYTPMVSYAPAAVGCPTGGCGTGVSYAPSAPALASPGPGCSSCGTSSPSATTYPTYPSSPMATPGVPGSTVPSLNQIPASPAPEQSAPPQTFRDEPSVADPQSRLKKVIPVPANEDEGTEASNKKTNSTLTPRLLNPNDRTTYRPYIKRAVTVIPVSAEEDADGGWRPARR